MEYWEVVSEYAQGFPSGWEASRCAGMNPEWVRKVLREKPKRIRQSSLTKIEKANPELAERLRPCVMKAKVRDRKAYKKCDPWRHFCAPSCPAWEQCKECERTGAPLPCYDDQNVRENWNER